MPEKPVCSAQPENLLLVGQKLQIIFAIRANGSLPAKEFYDKELSDSERRRFRPPMERLAETRRVANQEHFKKVEGTEHLWEFKSHQIRLLGFYLDDGRFALAHGIKKKQDRLRQRDIQIAEQVRLEFVAREAATNKAHGEKLVQTAAVSSRRTTK